jgi:hypothetical protein
VDATPPQPPGGDPHGHARRLRQPAQGPQLVQPRAYARDHGAPGVYIDYRPYQGGRASQSAAWQVVRPGFKTDPNGHWRDYGHKTFTVYVTEEKEARLAEAIEWATKRYGITEWVKGPAGFGGTYYVPKATYDVAMAALKAARKVAGPQAPKPNVKVFAVESRSAFIGSEIVKALGLSPWVSQGDIYVSAPTKTAALEALAAAGFRQSAGTLRLSKSDVTQALTAAGVFDGTTKVLVMNARGTGQVLEVKPDRALVTLGRVDGYGSQTAFTANPDKED